VISLQNPNFTNSFFNENDGLQFLLQSIGHSRIQIQEGVDCQVENDRQHTQGDYERARCATEVVDLRLHVEKRFLRQTLGLIQVHVEQEDDVIEIDNRCVCMGRPREAEDALIEWMQDEVVGKVAGRQRQQHSDRELQQVPCVRV
jgi:hypothetical protein